MFHEIILRTTLLFPQPVSASAWTRYASFRNARRFAVDGCFGINRCTERYDDPAETKKNCQFHYIAPVQE
jgi:hypothetical protein